jgi:hypothetical protein
MVIGMFACRRRPAWLIVSAVAALLVLLPGVARADEAPYFTSAPMLKGAAVVGSTLQVVPSWTGDPTPTATYRWGRCPAKSNTCTVIDGQTAATYVVTAADVGYRIAAEITLANSAGTLKPVATAPTGIVAPAPAPDQPPGPAPVPPPASPPPPAASPVTLSNTATSLTNTKEAPAFLRPFPVVRIRGFFARRGARITLLSVRGPRSAKVNVRCSGHGCPVRNLSLPTADTRVHRFERFLRAGILLQIRITRPGRIGSYTSFLIRSRKAPLRTDRCLSAKRGKPIQCSAP